MQGTCPPPLVTCVPTTLRTTQVLYRAAKGRFDEDAEFKQRSRQAVTELQGGRPEYLQVCVAGGRCRVMCVCVCDGGEGRFCVTSGSAGCQR